MTPSASSRALPPDFRAMGVVVAEVAKGRARTRRGSALERQACDLIAIGAAPSVLRDFLGKVLVVRGVVELHGLPETLHPRLVVRDVAGPRVVRRLVDQCRDAGVPVDCCEPAPAQVHEVLPVGAHAALLEERVLIGGADRPGRLGVALLVAHPLPDVADLAAAARTAHCLVRRINVTDAVQQLPLDEVHGPLHPRAHRGLRQLTGASKPLCPEGLRLPSRHLRKHHRDPSLRANVADCNLFLRRGPLRADVVRGCLVAHQRRRRRPR
mmetsp:Transcript_102671/g.329048  ORF Transcript_102671/g.329048 Transcript_102671/m.329048 type:complete len:268 (-) Transcript_102671:1063-1866(-)